MTDAPVTNLQRRLLSTHEAAYYLGISKRGFEYLVADGQVLKIRIGARTLFDRDDLDAYIERVKAAS